MKLYFHPVSTTSRAVALFAAEAGIPLDYQVVDLMTGEHLQPAYLAINPNGMVPVLEDGDFRLTESSAILKYLGDHANSPAYPKDLRERARVNEMLDWFNANLYKDFAYGIVYPQLFPHHKRPTDAAHSGAIEWGKQKSQRWLSLLDEKLIGKDKAFLCGKSPTVADHFGASILTLGDLLSYDFAPYPNVRRWLGNVRGLPSWGKVNEAFNGWAASMKGKPFVTP
jgi:glutathione S-transferase